MKTVAQLHEILRKHDFRKVDLHIHTHLCDGEPDMTVENIANQAMEKGLTCIVLQPHFHKQVSDETATLYTDTDEEILVKLREEIEKYYAAHGTALTIDGTTALKLSARGEAALDLVTPTVNYHPLLPLKAVEVTYGACICEIHGSGLYRSFVEKAGGVAHIMQTLYEAEVNAILRCPYPCMLGHFLAAHARPRECYSWFGAEEEHLEIMKQGAEKILAACQKTGAMIDLTGVRPNGEIDETLEGKRIRDGFFYDFQRWFIAKCKEKGIIALPGTDSHALVPIGTTGYYPEIMV